MITTFGNFANYAHAGTGTQAQALACRNSHLDWIVDSGASRHVTGASSEFTSYTPHNHHESVQTADGTSQPIKGAGTVKCTPSITLSSVLHVPTFPVNLISVSSIVDQLDCRVIFDRDICLFQERTGKRLGTGVRRDGLWYLDRESSDAALAAVCGGVEAEEVYMVTEAEKRSWHPLPRSSYPKPVVFHDGRIAFFPTPLQTLTMFLWVPLGLPLSVFRVFVFVLLPYKIAVPIGTFTGIKATYSAATHQASRAQGSHHLYVCNHRTLLDPIYISATLNKLVTAVTYSVSPISEFLSPIPTVRLTRNKEEDRKGMEKYLNKGDLVVCPEGTTCREPYLLRFSPLFAELTDEVIPVALVTTVSMFYGTTASGFKWLDPFYFLMNPNPWYDLKFLDKIRTGLGGRSCSYDVANRVQKEIGSALGFDCTALTRRDKYLMLAGNEGIAGVKRNPKGQ